MTKNYIMTTSGRIRVYGEGHKLLADFSEAEACARLIGFDQLAAKLHHTQVQLEAYQERADNEAMFDR